MHILRECQLHEGRDFDHCCVSNTYNSAWRSYMVESACNLSIDSSIVVPYIQSLFPGLSTEQGHANNSSFGIWQMSSNPRLSIMV